MLRTFYMGLGVAMIIGYTGWTAMGWELVSRDPVPTASRSGSGSSRSRGGFFGGGYGFGK